MSAPPKALKTCTTVGASPAGTLSRSVSGLPTNSSTVWVQLWWKTGGNWQSANYQYTAAGGGSGGGTPTITSPAPGSTLPGASTTFSWTPNSTSVSEWWLYVGTSQGDKNLHDSGSIAGGTLSRSVSGYRPIVPQCGSSFGGKQAATGSPLTTNIRLHRKAVKDC